MLISSSRLAIAILLFSLAGLSGCATNAAPPDERSPADPWEPLNRNIHRFNGGLDAVTFRPAAKVYEAAVPATARLGVRNFSRNLRTPVNILNNFLQGKPRRGFSETGRFLANSTFGIFGLIDVATDMGLERHREDFGQTLAVWGVPDGPFVVVPFLGPWPLRDALALPVDFNIDLLAHYDNSSARTKLWVLRFIDLRQALFTAEELLKDSPDRYLTIRESVLQRRQYLIYDGDPPLDDDFYEDYLDEEDSDQTQ